MEAKSVNSSSDFSQRDSGMIKIPDGYSIQDLKFGMIKAALWYNNARSYLHIHLYQTLHLENIDGGIKKGINSDGETNPIQLYITLQLLPDLCKKTILKSHTKTKRSCTIFNQSFKYQINSSGINDKHLKIMLHSTERNSPILSELVINLKSIPHESRGATKWYVLTKNMQGSTIRRKKSKSVILRLSKAGIKVQPNSHRRSSSLSLEKKNYFPARNSSCLEDPADDNNTRRSIIRNGPLKRLPGGKFKFKDGTIRNQSYVKLPMLRVSCWYATSSQTVNVHIFEARNLPNEFVKVYTKVQIQPHESNKYKKKTKLYDNNTTNPLFNVPFEWSISQTDLSTKKLILSVWGKKNSRVTEWPIQIGVVRPISLDDIPKNKLIEGDMWYFLQKKMIPIFLKTMKTPDGIVVRTIKPTDQVIQKMNTLTKVNDQGFTKEGVLSLLKRRIKNLSSNHNSPREPIEQKVRHERDKPSLIADISLGIELNLAPKGVMIKDPKNILLPPKEKKSSDDDEPSLERLSTSNNFLVFVTKDDDDDLDDLAGLDGLDEERIGAVYEHMRSEVFSRQSSQARESSLMFIDGQWVKDTSKSRRTSSSDISYRSLESPPVKSIASLSPCMPVKSRTHAKKKNLLAPTRKKIQKYGTWDASRSNYSHHRAVSRPLDHDMTYDSVQAYEMAPGNREPAFLVQTCLSDAEDQEENFDMGNSSVFESPIPTDKSSNQNDIMGKQSLKNSSNGLEGRIIRVAPLMPAGGEYPDDLIFSSDDSEESDDMPDIPVISIGHSQRSIQEFNLTELEKNSILSSQNSKENKLGRLISANTALIALIDNTNTLSTDICRIWRQYYDKNEKNEIFCERSSEGNNSKALVKSSSTRY